MKGRFYLKPHPEYPEQLLFGNLGAKSWEVEHYAVCDLTSPSNTVGRMVAHDLIEHNQAHRFQYWVTVREELNALGACAFIRPEIDLQYDVDRLMEYSSDLQPITHIKIPEFVCVDCFNEETDPIAIQHINYGYWLKHNQFKGDNYKARNAFEFIQEKVNRMFDYTHLDFGEYISILFDTDKHIFESKVRRCRM